MDQRFSDEETPDKMISKLLSMAKRLVMSFRMPLKPFGFDGLPYLLGSRNLCVASIPYRLVNRVPSVTRIPSLYYSIRNRRLYHQNGLEVIVPQLKQLMRLDSLKKAFSHIKPKKVRFHVSPPTTVSSAKLILRLPAQEKLVTGIKSTDEDSVRQIQSHADEYYHQMTQTVCGLRKMRSMGFKTCISRRADNHLEFTAVIPEQHLTGFDSLSHFLDHHDLASLGWVPAIASHSNESEIEFVALIDSELTRLGNTIKTRSIMALRAANDLQLAQFKTRLDCESQFSCF